MFNLQTTAELKTYLSELPGLPSDYKIAIGSLIFNDQGQLLLIERSGQSRDSLGKLEGIGGGLEPGEENLHQALQREIREEIGTLEVKIAETLTVLTLPGQSDHNFWVVPIYLCRLLSGIPTNMEPHKIKSVQWYDLSAIPQEKLSEYQKVTMSAYQKRFGLHPYPIKPSNL